MRNLFLDLDGVLSDFYGTYERLFGVRFKQDTYEPPDMLDRIREYGTFYRDQTLMDGAMELWDFAKFLTPNPIILTGVPHSVPNVAKQKEDWVHEHISSSARVICCYSKDKHKHGKPGDILVDDRKKYSKFWIDMGGLFVVHYSVEETKLVLGAVFNTFTR